MTAGPTEKWVSIKTETPIASPRAEIDRATERPSKGIGTVNVQSSAAAAGQCQLVRYFSLAANFLILQFI